MRAVREGLNVSARRARKALDRHRSGQRHRPHLRDDEDALTAADQTPFIDPFLMSVLGPTPVWARWAKSVSENPGQTIVSGAGGRCLGELGGRRPL